MKDGIFISKVKGFHGPLTLHVEIKNDQIKNIKLAGLVPYTVGETAAKQMAQKIIKAGTSKVDIISSASYSSDAVKKGTEKAEAVAAGKMSQEEATDLKQDKFRKPQPPKYQAPINQKFYESVIDYNDSYDMVIAGSGVAGLAAAVIGAQNGLKVKIFEKAGMAGGTSKYSEGEVQAAATEVQKQYSKYKNDSVAAHIKEMELVGGSDIEKDLVEDYAKDAPKIIKWLADLGIKWTGVFGHKGLPYEDPSEQADRIHYYEHGAIGGAGIILTNLLLNKALALGASISYDSPVIALIKKDSHSKQITGVVVNQQGKRGFYQAKKGVLLATSSIDHNLNLSKQFSPENYRDLVNGQVHTANTDTGDGIQIGLNEGAAVTGFGGVVDSNIRIPEARNSLPTVPAIFVNGLGHRYVNEELTYGYLTYQNFLQQETLKKDTWALFDQSILGIPGTWQNEKDLAKDIRNKFVVKADNAEELASKTKMPLDGLKETINNWNKNAAKGEDPEFGRKLKVQKLNWPLYAYHMVDGNYSALGGLKVNVNQQVLDNNNEVIPGLYAAGTNAGGFIGHVYYASGLALGTGLHGGRKAAQTMAGLVKDVTPKHREKTDATSGASQK